ncbi:MAG: hypothetical protein ACK4QL_06195 [Pseudanabaenaceae cyanobacterium]
MQGQSNLQILALHTTSDTLQISIGTPTQSRTITAQVGRELGTYLHHYLDQAVADNWHTLLAVAVHTGPGSQTGKRIGLAVAQTIASQLGIPVYQIDRAETSQVLLTAAWLQNCSTSLVPTKV